MAEHPSANDLGDAVRSLDFEAVKCSLDAGGDPNARGITGWTPLHYVCWLGREDLVKLLLSYGADVNAKNKWGFTTLHWACKYYSLGLARMLLENGADPNARDDNGAAPMDMILTNELANEYTEAREALLALFQELAPAAYFEAFCTAQSPSPGASR